MESVFVDNLPFNLTEQEFTQAFVKFGPIRSVTIAHVRTHYGYRSKGYGFVDFEKEEDRQACLNSNERIEIKGRTLFYRAARPRTNLDYFLTVTNIYPNVTDQQLFNHFIEYHPVEARIVHTNPNTNLSFGYIKFDSLDNRQHALEKMNETLLGNSNIRVKPSFKPFH